jgi:nucleoside-diphosphate-sugar epimerase
MVCQGIVEDGMRVFVTGATGYLGRAIAARLVKGGYEVHGLTRKSERAETLRGIGVRPVVGDITRPESYVAELKNCDAVVHAATFDEEVAKRDQMALETIRAGVVDGRVRHFLFTSGVWVHGETGVAIEDETDPPKPAELVAWRPAHEEVALDMVEHEAHVSVMRPGLVYGGVGGIFGGWFREARAGHPIGYPGDGHQRWNLVHRDDVAEGYRLALEHGRGGQRFLLVDESRFTARELAEAAARAAGVEARPLSREQTLERYGKAGLATLMDQRVTSARARRELGWVPRHSSFVAEIEDLYREWAAGQKAAVA